MVISHIRRGADAVAEDAEPCAFVHAEQQVQCFSLFRLGKSFDGHSALERLGSPESVHYLVCLAQVDADGDSLSAFQRSCHRHPRPTAED